MWMRLGKLLQIAQGDRTLIAALLIQAFCTGIFVGVLELEANTVFLEGFGADRVPFAMMVSGLAGILIAAIYGYFSKQLKARAFGIVNMVAVIGATVLFAGSLIYLERDYFDFTTFVVSAPLILITLMGFRTTVRGFISPSRGKQLGGLIEVSLIGGMALAFFSSPLLVTAGIAVHELLYPGMGSLIVATVFQMYILSHSSARSGGYRLKRGSAGPIRLFSTRYTALMASFVVIGVAISVMLYYQFLAVTQSRFPGGSELVEFLGFFFGIAVLLAWLMKRFLFHWLKSKFGVRTTLLVMPVILLLLTIPASIFGESFGYGGESSLPISLCWLFSPIFSDEP
jgi:ATP:ADP antiporter, AAA family